MYVLQLGVANKASIRQSFDLLRQAHARILGVVYNKFDAKSHGTYYGSYYGYHEYLKPEAKNGHTHTNGSSSGQKHERSLPKDRNLETRGGVLLYRPDNGSKKPENGSKMHENTDDKKGVS